MKKTLLTLAMILGGLLSTQAQESEKLTLDDNEDLVPIINAAAEKGGTYDITFSSRPVIMDNWDVFCLPFDVSPAQISKVLGYVAVARLIENSDDGDVHFEPAVSGLIPAGTPFIINVGKMKRTPSDYKRVTFNGVTLKKVEASYTVTDSCGNRFISTFSPVDLIGSNYYFMSEGDWYSAEDSVLLKPMRCYIDCSDNFMTDAPQIVIADGGTTAIFDVKAFNKGEFIPKKGQDNAWYTLTGTRLTAAPNSKGVYIRQGRKVVIR